MRSTAFRCHLLRRDPDAALGFLIGHGEVAREPHNRVELDPELRDAGRARTLDCSATPEADQAMARHMQNRIAAVVGQAGGQVAPVEDLLRMPLVEPLVCRSVAGSQSSHLPATVHELGGAPWGRPRWVCGSRNRMLAVPISWSLMEPAGVRLAGRAQRLHQWR